MKRLWIGGLTLLAAACATGRQETAGAGPSAQGAHAAGTEAPRPWLPLPGASAALKDASGSVVGQVRLVPEAGGTRVSVVASHLPLGTHGIHIHAIGRCEPPDFVSAGPHWNPTRRQHGRQNPQGMHAGDLPNLSIGADGRGRVDTVIAGDVFSGREGALLDLDGAAVVIHAQPDDERTDPSGNSGARIACGVLH